MPVKMPDVTASLTKGERNRIKPASVVLKVNGQNRRATEQCRRGLTEILNVPEVLSTRDGIRGWPWRPVEPAFEEWLARFSTRGDPHHLAVIWPCICAEYKPGRDSPIGSNQACPGMGLAPFAVAFFDVLYRDGA